MVKSLREEAQRLMIGIPRTVQDLKAAVDAHHKVMVVYQSEIGHEDPTWTDLMRALIQFINISAEATKVYHRMLDEERARHMPTFPPESDEELEIRG